MAASAASTRIERALAAAVAASESPEAPPLLIAAMRHAVFPGGARIRPQLCLAVASACGDDEPVLADAAAAAIELLHCASLVHDDLPCFDDAPTRRGRPSVHRAFGERLAVLTGDALIVLAFQVLGQAAAAGAVAGRTACTLRLAPLLATVAAGVGAPCGIAAGQAWECEPRVVLADYQRAKTGALFAAATAAGALSAGADLAAWRGLGEWLGEAYQVADDIRDAAADAEWLGKPTGRDVALDRPSAAREHGLNGAIDHFGRLVARAAAAIPPCRGAGALRALLCCEAERLIPASLFDAAQAQAQEQAQRLVSAGQPAGRARLAA